MIRKLASLFVFVAAFSLNAHAQSHFSAGPLQITLAISKTEFIPREDIITTATYKNISKEPVRVLKLVAWGYPLTFDIVDANGRHSANIKIARSKFNVDLEKDFIELQPNETFSQQYVFHEMFSFPETGHYTITATYSPLWELGTMTSNAVAVDILGEADVEDLAQFVLNIDELQQYFHPELPGRKPLVLLKNQFFTHDPDLTKFGEPVLVLVKDQIDIRGYQNYFEFTDMEFANGNVDVNFLYPLENLSGKVSIEKRNNEWQIRYKQIVKAK